MRQLLVHSKNNAMIKLMYQASKNLSYQQETDLDVNLLSNEGILGWG